MRSTTTRVALGLWVLAMVSLAVTTLILGTPDDTVSGFLIAAISALVVGAIITARVTGNVVGPLFLITGSVWVLYVFGSSYGLASLEAAQPLPAAYFLAWLGGWIGAVLPLGMAAVLLVFPTGKPFGWWRVLLLGPIAGSISCFIGAAMIWGQPIPTLIDSDLISEVEGYQFVDAAFILGFFTALLATFSVVARYRRAEPTERQQIKWLLAATSLFAVAFFFGAVIDDSNEVLWWIATLALAAIPISVLFAVLRYRLYEIDRIISRTVSYVIVIGFLAAVYLAGLSLLSSLFSESSLAVAASTLAAAALFAPLRRRVQAWVERRFNRSRYDAQQVVDGFSGSLREDLDPDTLVRGWVNVVSETMQPETVSVWVRNDSGTLEG